MSIYCKGHVNQSGSDTSDKILSTETDGKVELNGEHDYYCQVQGQLFVTGVPFCVFVVYT